MRDKVNVEQESNVLRVLRLFTWLSHAKNNKCTKEDVLSFNLYDTERGEPDSPVIFEDASTAYYVIFS